MRSAGIAYGGLKAPDSALRSFAASPPRTVGVRRKLLATTDSDTRV